MVGIGRTAPSTRATASPLTMKKPAAPRMARTAPGAAVPAKKTAALGSAAGGALGGMTGMKKGGVVKKKK